MKQTINGQEYEVVGTVRYDFTSTPEACYIGEASRVVAQDTDACWQIKKITFDASSNPLSTLWASEGKPLAAWADRLSLAYS